MYYVWLGNLVEHLLVVGVFGLLIDIVRAGIWGTQMHVVTEAQLGWAHVIFSLVFTLWLSYYCYAWRRSESDQVLKFVHK